MDSDVIYEQVISKISSDIYGKPELAKATLIKFAEIQAQQPHLGMKNMIALAVLAKNEGIEISEVNTYNAWKQKDQRIQILNNANSLYIYAKKQLPNKRNVLIKIPVYDYSQTNAAQFGYIPKNENILLLNHNNESNENFLNSFKNHLVSKGYVSRINNKENSFNINTGIFNLNNENKPEDNVRYLIERIVKSRIFDLSTMEPNSKEYNEILFLSKNEKETIEKLVLKSILNKFNIKVNSNINITPLGVDSENKIKIIASEIRNNIENLGIEEFLKNRQDRYFQEFKSAHQNIRKKPRKWVEFSKLTDSEKDTLKKRGYESIVSSDPSTILSRISANFRPHTSGYKIDSIDGEKTTSTSFYLKDGRWSFNRFGGVGQSGSIIDFVMIETKLDIKDALELCYDALNIKNPLQEAYESIKLENERKMKEAGITPKNNTAKKSKPQKAQVQETKKDIAQILKETKERNENIKSQNEELEKQNSNRSRVSRVSKMIPPKFKIMMRERGIAKLPKEALHLTLEFKKDDGSTYEVQGIGILAGPEEDLNNLYDILDENTFCNINEDWDNVTLSGDVHFPAYKSRDGKMRKTQSAGPKQFTYINNNGKNSKKCAVFESKNDYFAAAQLVDYNSQNIDVFVGNGIGQARKINKAILDNNYSLIDFYTQNDIPALKFMSDTLQGYSKGIKSIRYETKEFGQDINDLILAHPNQDVTKRLKQSESANRIIVDMIDNMEKYIKDIKDEKTRTGYENELKKVADKLDIYNPSQPTFNL